MANGDNFTIVKENQVAIHAAQNGFVEWFGVAQFAATADTTNELVPPFDTILGSSFSPIGNFAAGEGEIGINETPVSGIINRDANSKITIKRGGGGTTDKIHFRIRGY